jgi:PKD repeat protein
VALKALSHEYNETITDPVDSGGWYASSTGQENGDECNFYGTAADPANDTNPNAFTPYLGGTASAGNLFNQLVNADKYYVQSEWSNGGLNCRMQPTSSALSPAFSAPGVVSPGASVSFDPVSSTSAGGYTSATWGFGDGGGSFARGAPATSSHTFAAVGTYTVTLTLVDTFGNLATVSHTILVTQPPAAAFSSTPATPVAGSPVSFDGSASSDPSAAITSYSWDFGDGSDGSGATISHAYAAPGTYTVRLTVGDGAQSGSVAHAVTVASGALAPKGVPIARIARIRHHGVAGVPFRFHGSTSGDTGSPLVAYRWRFGDGGSAAGTSPRHTFKRIGTYSVSLTVTDASGQRSTSTRSIAVKAPSIGKIRVKRGKKIERLKIAVSGPGLLRFGSKRFEIRRPRTVTIKVGLSGSQQGTLARRHRLTVRYRLSFAPKGGKTGHKTVTIKLKS